MRAPLTNLTGSCTRAEMNSSVNCEMTQPGTSKSSKGKGRRPRNQQNKRCIMHWGSSWLPRSEKVAVDSACLLSATLQHCIHGPRREGARDTLLVGLTSIGSLKLVDKSVNATRPRSAAIRPASWAKEPKYVWVKISNIPPCSTQRVSESSRETLHMVALMAVSSTPMAT